MKWNRNHKIKSQIIPCSNVLCKLHDHIFLPIAFKFDNRHLRYKLFLDYDPSHFDYITSFCVVLWDVIIFVESHIQLR